MIVRGQLWVVIIVSALMSSATGLSAAEDPAPFPEVYELIRTNLTGINEKALNRAAVKGLINELSPKVALVTNSTRTVSPGETPLLDRPNVFDREIGYLRIGKVSEGLAELIRQSYQSLAATNKLKGLVLDLRYAGGEDYASAAAVADLFVKKERPLINWGKGTVRSHEKGNAIGQPLAVLVNHETARAAEALAGVLREVGAGLVLGSQTAGEAMIAQEFPLSTGGRLRIATGTIEVGEKTPFPLRGLAPDIAVEVNSDDERVYFADAFKVIPKSSLLAGATLSLTNPGALTNRASRRARFNEAELVRERREGSTADEEETTKRDEELEGPVVHDPVLARALDLLKGLAVVRQSRF